MIVRSRGRCVRTGMVVFVTPPGHAQLSAVSVMLGSVLLCDGYNRRRKKACLYHTATGTAVETVRRGDLVQSVGELWIKWVQRAQLAVKGALANMMAESLVALVLYPLDTVKLRCQLRLPQVIQPHRKALAMVAQLYSGVCNAAITAAPVAGVFAAVYHATKRKLQEIAPHEHLRFACAIVAGAVGTAVSSLVDTPFKLTRELVQCGACASTKAAWQGLFSSGMSGHRYLFKAFRADLLSSLPFDALEFATYEQLRALACNARRGKEPTDFELLCIGMLTGALVGAATSPLSVLRARMTAQPLRYVSMRQSAQLIFVEEGLHGFFSGVRASVFREAVNSGAFFAALETFNSVLERRELRS
uniref:Mitochondrial carrier protein n=1 Tax=Erythrolobus madagascarensis TaxID=708628 RepID=A0A7S0T6S0_9RHOD